MTFYLPAADPFGAKLSLLMDHSKLECLVKRLDYCV